MKNGKVIMNFTDFGNRKWKDKLEGGKADDKTPDDFNSDDIAIGTSVEREHTSNPDIATEIAMDHLEENPEYYDELIASGIADEEESIDLFDELKGKNSREKAQKDIKDFMEEGDSDDGDYYDDDEGKEEFDEGDFDEDELGTDLADIGDEDLITEEPDPKNKKNIMEKNIKNYKRFLNESEEVVMHDQPPTPGPTRSYSVENKYKFQLPWSKKTEEKLQEYGFTLASPENPTKPGKGAFIIMDIMNLNYTIVGEANQAIRPIDTTKLEDLIKGL